MILSQQHRLIYLCMHVCVCDVSRDLYIYLLLRDKTSQELMDKYIGPLLIGKQDTLTDS